MSKFGKFLELCWYTAELPGQPVAKRIAARAVLVMGALVHVASRLVLVGLVAYGMYRLVVG